MSNDDIKNWDNISQEFVKQCETNSFKTQFLYPLILKNIGSIKSRKILDIGCGSGVFARMLKKNGAQVFAADGSKKLLEIAEKDNKDKKITYLNIDLNKKNNLNSRYFDFVTSVHAVMDIENYQNVIKESFRVLKSGGKFIIAIPHPCFSHPIIYLKKKLLGRINNKWSKIFWSSYFERKKVNKYLVGSYKTNYYHRTIGDYLNEIIKNKFVIEKILEPKIPKNIAYEIDFALWDYFPNTIIIIASRIQKG
jgi:ubiquinone/menaquinone biosynthesis C-methylase UbiE